MGRAFWIKRFLAVAVGVFFVLTLVELAKGHDLVAALFFGLGWGVIASAIFTAGRIYHSRRGQACAICNDTPEPRK